MQCKANIQVQVLEQLLLTRNKQNNGHLIKISFCINFVWLRKKLSQKSRPNFQENLFRKSNRDAELILIFDVKKNELNS